MGNVVSSNPNQDVKSEDIHKVLLSVFTKLTNTKQPFELRKGLLTRTYEKHKSCINPLFPHLFQFTKTCFEYEFFVFVGTIGSFAIDMVVYYDLFDWIVLNDRTNFRSYKTTGSSKLQHCVSKRKTLLTEEDRAQLDEKKREVETIMSTTGWGEDSSSLSSSTLSSSQDGYFNRDVSNFSTKEVTKTREVSKPPPRERRDTKQTEPSTTERRVARAPAKAEPVKTPGTDRKPPSCRILTPNDGAKVDCEFLMELEFINWKMTGPMCYLIQVDGDERGSFSNEDPVSMNLHGYRKGDHTVEIQLIGAGGVPVFTTKRRVWLRADCPHQSLSSATTIGSDESDKDISSFITRESVSDCDSESYSSSCRIAGYESSSDIDIKKILAHTNDSQEDVSIPSTSCSCETTTSGDDLSSESDTSDSELNFYESRRDAKKPQVKVKYVRDKR